jgi:hypothetical protein
VGVATGDEGEREKSEEEPHGRSDPARLVEFLGCWTFQCLLNLHGGQTVVE